MTHIPFSPDFESKGYKLIYRNGERPEDYKVWPDGSVTTYFKGSTYPCTTDGKDLLSKDFDLFLTPPEMYVAIYEQYGSNVCTNPIKDLDHLRNLYGNGATYYRLVPVEPSSQTNTI